MAKKFNSHRIAVLGLMTALGLIMFSVESLFPTLFLPGAKMGLSNIVSLFTLLILGPIDAILVVIVRTVLGSLILGTIGSLIYSLSAGLISIITSALLYKLLFPKISIISISIFAAVLHNLTQNILFCIISETPQMYAYMPYMALLGVLAGAIVGIAVYLLIMIMPEKSFTPLYKS